MYVASQNKRTYHIWVVYGKQISNKCIYKNTEKKKKTHRDVKGHLFTTGEIRVDLQPRYIIMSR